MDPPAPMCWICHEGRRTKNDVLLQNVCKCKGSLRYVHNDCLLKWINTKSSNEEKRCPQCMHKYTLKTRYDTILDKYADSPHFPRVASVCILLVAVVAFHAACTRIIFPKTQSLQARLFRKIYPSSRFLFSQSIRYRMRQFFIEFQLFILMIMGVYWSMKLALLAGCDCSVVNNAVSVIDGNCDSIGWYPQWEVYLYNIMYVSIVSCEEFCTQMQPLLVKKNTVIMTMEDTM